MNKHAMPRREATDRVASDGVTVDNVATASTSLRGKVSRQHSDGRNQYKMCNK